MSRGASNFQKKVMSWGYRGKEIFKPLNTGWIDEHTACVREWIANIFFYTKNGTTIMIDAGYKKDGRSRTLEMLAIELDTSVEKVERDIEFLENAGLIRRVRFSGTQDTPPPVTAAADAVQAVKPVPAACPREDFNIWV